jgi:hypothetical protein
VDATGNVYVADTYNQAIRKITAAGVVSTLAGAAPVSGSTDGAGAAARFTYPKDVAVDASGNLFVADTGNQTIRKITAAGDATTLVGTAGVRGSVDGTGAAASFNGPLGLAVDASGNMYVADANNSTIRKITAAGVVSTLAGTAVLGSTDGTGAAARFNTPTSVAVDASGNVYVADSYNFTIRKITAAGVVTTLAGTAGVRGGVDGTGAAASFWYPQGVAVDTLGNVYVADTYNHTIRKITAAGVVTTLAGTAGAWGSTDGTGAAARFFYPTSVDMDASGNVYVADTYNNTLRKITAAGVVTTVVGKAGSQGFVPGALPGVIGYTSGLAISGSTLYFTNNNGIAKVTNLP